MAAAIMAQQCSRAANGKAIGCVMSGLDADTRQVLGFNGRVSPGVPIPDLDAIRILIPCTLTCTRFDKVPRIVQPGRKLPRVVAPVSGW